MQEEDNGHHSVTGEPLVFEKSSNIYKRIGSTVKFFPLAQLKEKNYLKNDTLKFRLWLKVVSWTQSYVGSWPVDSV